MAREFAAANQTAKDDSFAAILLGDEFSRPTLGSILLSEHMSAEIIEADSFDDVIRTLSSRKDISLVVLDLTRSATGVDNVALLRRSFPAVRIVVMLESDERRHILALLTSGAHGCFAKSCGINEFKKALAMVLNGMVYVPSSISDVSASENFQPCEIIHLATSREPAPTDPHLTPRQLQVLQLLTQGKLNKEICRSLHLGQGTVKVHVAGIFRTLNVRSRTGAAVLGANILNSNGVLGVAV